MVTYLKYTFTILYLLFHLKVHSVTCFLKPCLSWRSKQQNHFSKKFLTSKTSVKLLSNNSDNDTSSSKLTDIFIKKYYHGQDNIKLTYRYKPASKGYETTPPLVLIHPVGIGISSWFWIKFMNQCNKGPAIYAVDLIGCGIENGADVWDPDKIGLFFPLSWAQACETLINTIVLPQVEGFKRKKLSLFDKSPKNESSSGCIVVVQGGLAPVGVLLASRNPTNIVSKLILTSPPTWKDMTTSIPESELEQNYNFLRSKFLGNLAFSILEKRKIVETFSNLFLFQDSCDDEFLDYVDNGVCEGARSPIQVFNAGLLNHRSYEEELKSIDQPTLILSGESDKRKILREPYKLEMKRCTLQTINGLNVLPWENSDTCVESVLDFMNK